MADFPSANPGGDGGGTSNELEKRVIVKSSADLAGVLDSTKEYFLDGIVDMGSTEIIVPVGGLNLKGYDFNISGLISSADNYTMFKSESLAVKSGDVLGSDYLVSVTGANSKVYELYSATSNETFEFTRVNYNNCTSLGDLYDYRQGLEFGTGRFGGSPSLTLHGLWAGGYRITTSIVRGLAGTMTEPLFKEGTLFQMNSRFLTDINCDLPTLAPLFDFKPVNFPNPGTIQLRGCEITRDGAYDADDMNLTPDIGSSDLACYWTQNNGMNNTFVGGASSVITEQVTTVTVQGDWYDIAGVFLGTGEQHFTASTDGKLTHNGSSPREFEITSNLAIEGPSNIEVEVRFRKWDDSASVFIDLDYTIQARQVNSFVGGRDVAFFNINTGVTLDQNDYIQMQVRNNSGTGNVTLESSSFFRVQER